jgi:outer membrane protein assembly factor BamB
VKRVPKPTRPVILVVTRRRSRLSSIEPFFIQRWIVIVAAGLLSTTFASGTAIGASRRGDTGPVGSNPLCVREMQAQTAFRLPVCAAPRSRGAYGLSSQATPTSMSPRCTTIAQELIGRCPTWSATYDNGDPESAGGDLPTSVEVSPNGATVIEAGATYRSTTDSYDFGVVAHDASRGTKKWAASYGPHDRGHDVPFDLAVSPDSAVVYVAGVVNGTSPPAEVRELTQHNFGISAFGVAAFDMANGKRIWDKTLALARYAQTVATEIVVSADGRRVYAAGMVDRGGRLARDVLTVAFSSNSGRRLWMRAPKKAGDAFAVDLTTNEIGSRVFVASQTSSLSGDNTDYAIVAYQGEGPARGLVRWESTYDGGTNEADRPKAIGYDSATKLVYITGQSAARGLVGAAGHTEFATVAYHGPTGTRIWARRERGTTSGTNAARSLASLDGRVFVTGLSTDHLSNLEQWDSDFLTVAYDGPTGQLLWRTRESTAGFIEEIPAAIAASADGSVVVTGHSFHACLCQSDALTVAYDASRGTALWTSRTNSSPALIDYNYAIALAVHPDNGSAFVAAAIMDHVRSLNPVRVGANISDFGLLGYLSVGSSSRKEA